MGTERLSPTTKKIIGVAFAILLGVNAWFVQDLASTVKTTANMQIADRAKVDQIAKEVSEVRESVKPFHDLRIDVAVLKYSVQELRDHLAKERKPK